MVHIDDLTVKVKAESAFELIEKKNVWLKKVTGSKKIIYKGGRTTDEVPKNEKGQRRGWWVTYVTLVSMSNEALHVITSLILIYLQLSKERGCMRKMRIN